MLLKIVESHSSKAHFLPLLQAGTEALSMRDAMKSLKMQALEISVRSQKEADVASAERKSLEDELKGVAAQLQVRGYHRVGGSEMLTATVACVHCCYVIIICIAVVADLQSFTRLSQWPLVFTSRSQAVVQHLVSTCVSCRLDRATN